MQAAHESLHIYVFREAMGIAWDLFDMHTVLHAQLHQDAKISSPFITRDKNASTLTPVHAAHDAPPAVAIALCQGDIFRVCMDSLSDFLINGCNCFLHLLCSAIAAQLLLLAHVGVNGVSRGI